MTNKDLTIIIATFNSEEKIQNCLESIGQDYKVIIVENSKNTDFKNKIEKNFKNVECLLAEKNLGYGQANNLALEKAKTKYSLILNPDTRLKRNAIDNFFVTAEKNSNFAILAPLNGQSFSKEVKNNLELIEVKNVKGFAMFLNMEKFEKIGFFDKNFFLYFEEIDLCRRVIDNKEKIFLDPSIEINHDGGKSVNQSFSYQIELTRNWHWMWSTFYYHKKYDGFFIAGLKVSQKFFSAFFKSIFYTISLNKEKKEIYLHRLSGLLNSILGKSSWHRPNLD